MSNNIFLYKPLLAVITVFSVIFSVLMPIFASSASPLCSVEVDIGTLEGLKGKNIAVDLYKTAVFSNGKCQMEAAFDTDGLKQAVQKMHDGVIQAELLDTASQEAAKAVYEKEGTASYKSLNSAEGKVMFQSLEPGVYLVIARDGGMPKEDSVKSESGRIVTYAENGDFLFEWLPVLFICMPAGNSSSAVIDLKPSKTKKEDNRAAELRIEKTLEKYSGRPVTFSFITKIYKNENSFLNGEDPEKTVQTDMVFEKAERKTALEGNILPEGAFITVSEKEKDGYIMKQCLMQECDENGNNSKTLSKGKNMSCEVKAGSIITAKFVNAATDSETPSDPPSDPDVPDKTENPNQPDSPEKNNPDKDQTHANQKPSDPVNKWNPVKTGDSAVLWIFLPAVIMAFAGYRMYKNKRK